ncbi:MAG: TIGR03936 family radical SAM-associated protein, partial [Chloroflexota bacterium]
MTESDIARIRITYSKIGMLRFIGHLDMQQLWERALRRAELPVRYSQGFNPKIRLNLASALPLGYISRCEVLDFWLEKTVACEIVQAKLNKTLPTDLKIIDTTRVANNLPSLQSLVSASDYQVKFSESLEFDHLQGQVKQLLSKDTIPRTRRGKTYNLRVYIQNLSITNL